MNYLFFDTETTGLPNRYDLLPTETDHIPRMVQLAWQLRSETGKLLNSDSYIIKPEGFMIPKESFQIHGITNERAKQEGEFLEPVLQDFMQTLKYADAVVCHNYNFDYMIVAAEMYRCEMDYQVLTNKPKYCTMLASMKFVGIKNYYGYKFPKLQELHQKLFGVEFNDAHDAANDVEATTNCFFELVRIKQIILQP